MHVVNLSNYGILIYVNTLQKLTPLIIIFILIILFTTAMLVFSTEPTWMYGMQMFMAGFFIIFSFAKIIRWKGFAMAYKKYDILAKRSNVYAHAYPAIELLLGVLFLTGFQLLFAAILTVIIMSIGIIGVAQKLREKEEIQCACLGVVFKLPMTYVTLIENALMIIMGIIMIVFLV